MDSNQPPCTTDPAQAERACQCSQSGQSCEECSSLNQRENAAWGTKDHGESNDANDQKTFDGPAPIMPPPKRARVDAPSVPTVQRSHTQPCAPNQPGGVLSEPPSIHTIDQIQVRRDMDDTRVRAQALIASKLGTGALENLCRNLAMLIGEGGASVGDGLEAACTTQPEHPEKEQKRWREGAIINHLATFVEDAVGDLKRQVPTLAHLEVLRRNPQQRSHAHLNNPMSVAGSTAPGHSGPRQPHPPAYNASVQALAGCPLRAVMGGTAIPSNSEGFAHLAASPGMPYSANPQNTRPPQPSTSTSIGFSPRFQGASPHPSTLGGVRTVQLLPPRTPRLGQFKSASMAPAPFPHPTGAAVATLGPTGFVPTQAPPSGFRQNVDMEGFDSMLSHQPGVSGAPVPTPGQDWCSNGSVPEAAPQANHCRGQQVDPSDPRLGVISGGDSNGVMGTIEGKQQEKTKHQHIGQTLEQKSRLKYLQN